MSCFIIFSLKLMLKYPKESLFKFKVFEILRNFDLHFVPAFISYYLSCSKLLNEVYYFLSDGLQQVGDFRHILWHWGFSTAQNSAKTPGTIYLFLHFFDVHMINFHIYEFEKNCITGSKSSHVCPATLIWQYMI